MSSYETIQTETDNHVRRIIFNRPDVFNACSTPMASELAHALQQAGDDDDVRVIVLTGAGKAFCSGQDLGELKRQYVPGFTPHLGDVLKERYDPIITSMLTMNTPIIASVNGVAAGAGCSLALACDVRIAAEAASFIEVFINVGLAPDTASTFLLPRIVGLGRAMELCLTGRPIDAEEALRIGLVTRVVHGDALRETTDRLALKLAKLPPRGLALTKRLLHSSFEHDLNAQLAAEARAQEEAGRTDDHFEGVVAFLEKRTPEFTGR
jgi:2-(1,2-epoxy-1,2-dihydrophenyl)acetyl-CoA isomerase